MSFQPKKIKTFRFTRYRFIEINHAARIELEYAFDTQYVFKEILNFPDIELPLSPKRRALLDCLLPQLHLVAGISYYKAAVPEKICIETRPIAPETAEFMRELYVQGLAEFAYRNDLDLSERVQFPADADKVSSCSLTDTLPRQTIIPLGGGKDSLLSVEILKAAKEPFKVFSVGNSTVIRDIAAKIDVPHIIVQRHLSPLLFALNDDGAYNGHVPITAIIAYITAISAVLYGFNTVVMSNERSANVGNLEHKGIEVNHQYSKSLAFEQKLKQQLNLLLPDFQYFSLLRPLSELDIARQFVRHPQYHPYFSSCNANFTLKKARHHGRWCLNCPKCRFVFLTLAAYMPKAQLLHIFPANLLDDPQQQAGFDALIGWDAHKPFECVGEVEESRAAFYLLIQHAEWQDDYLVKRFLEQQLPTLGNVQSQLDNALLPSQDHEVPARFMLMLEAYLNSYSPKELPPAAIS